LSKSLARQFRMFGSQAGGQPVGIEDSRMGIGWE
jgi:hypothetical protein